MLNLSERAKLKRIDPRDVKPSVSNPRSESFFKDDAFLRLRESIASFGVLVPIIVRELRSPTLGAAYRLVDGERRWRAALETNTRLVPAYILPMSSTRDDLSMMFQIHMHQEGWDALEQARSLERLVASLKEEASKLKVPEGETERYVQNQLVSRTGMSRGNAVSRLRFFRWPEEFRNRAYERDDDMLYSYMVEIEAQVLESAQRNYPELFDGANSVMQARRKLLEKVAAGTVTQAAEARVAAILTKRRSSALERRTAKALLRKLIDDKALSFQEAQEQYFISFPDEALRPTYSTRKLANLSRLISKAFDDYSDIVIGRLQKNHREVLLSAVQLLHKSAAELIRRLEAR